MASSATRTTGSARPEPSAPSPQQHSPADGDALAAFDREAQRWSMTIPASSSPRVALPEDDGKSALRRRIFSIQSRDVTAAEKARLMHRLLSEGHTGGKRRAPGDTAGSPSAVPALERNGLAERLQSLKAWYPSGDPAGPLPLPLSEADLAPTFVPDGEPDPDEEEQRNSTPEEAGDGPRPLGCEHYRRNVKMQCATCERWYTCRFCHDAVEDHTLPRKQTKNMLCMLCGTAQRVGDTCVRCAHPAARYYCGTCKLWNDDGNKSIYHCPDCDICRVGQGLGKDFFHCHVGALLVFRPDPHTNAPQKCHACIDIQIAASHKCIERSTDCDCPICGEYMFSSTRQVVFMRCGHSIHRTCYAEHMRRSYRCPLCSRSCVNMETQFRHLDLAIQRQPMPPEYFRARAVVACNDCSAKSQVRFHWLGLKCAVCQSYNTAQLNLLHMPDGAAMLALVGGRRDPDVMQDAAATADEDALGHDGAAAAGPDHVLATAPTVLSRPASPPSSSPTSSLTSSPARSSAPSRLRNRLGRSRPAPASSSSTISTAAAAVVGSSGPSGEEDDDDDEDTVDFWGGDDIPHVTSEGTGPESHDSGSDEHDDSEDTDECDNDDDDDEEDDIQLFGHP